MSIKNFFVKIPAHIKYLFKIYLTGIAIFTFFRIIIVITYLDEVAKLPEGETLYLMFNAFIMGFRFDTVISGYILIFPFIVFSLFAIFKRYNQITFKIFHYYIGVFYSIAFALCCIDIPFFKHYFSRLSTAIFQWTNDQGFIIKMIFQEWTYLIFVILFVALVIFYWIFINKKIFKKTFGKQKIISGRIIEKKHLVLQISLFIVLGLILFLGIRGRIDEKSPIRVGTAYFSAYPFPNQLGLNPVFTFIQSCLDDLKNKDEKINFMDEAEAIANVRGYFNITSYDFPSPISRFINPTRKQLKANVVLVIMESMSAEKMWRYGNRNNLTPYLDSLLMVSYNFDNFYSAGIHTFTGIYSSIFAYPILQKQHPMKRTPIPIMSGLPNTLKENGYRNYLFLTHDAQFDNVAGFMYANGFDRVFSNEDYPPEWDLSTLGVPDHIMFEQAIPRLSEIAKQNNLFFATLVTASDHGPYIIPEGIPFKPKTTDIHNQIVEYADWAIKRFMTLASQESWFKNTIFVFVADHGANIDPQFDLPLSFTHSPFIIFAPHILTEPRYYTELGGQIDIFPTIMGLLNIPYVNNTMGIDLFNETRPYIYFTADDKIGIVSDSLYMIIRPNGNESLYSYRTKNAMDLIKSQTVQADSMKLYVYSMMQTAQYILEKNLTNQTK
ncbi:MAG: sulfatase-like hydrolase/transferase [Ignavibacteriales bacterium]|nr:sulfatase-like hydrolase/transferase [Ignavibacteriales bacterium]